MICISICLGICLQAKCQLANDLAFIRAHQFSTSTKTTYSFRFSAESEYEFAAKLAYTIYKKYVSSQDAISCTFEPSCSTFGLHAIQQHGLVIGSMATFDRLSRCHGWNHSYYTQNPQNGLNIDPIHSDHVH